MLFNPRKPQRRSIRLQDYDYSQAGLYFITLSVQNKIHLFGKVQNGEMILNPLGQIAYDEWENTSIIRKNVSIDAFIMMPNHMHGIIKIDYSLGQENLERIGKFKSPTQTIGAIIRGYKGATTKKIKAYLRDISTLGRIAIRPNDRTEIRPNGGIERPNKTKFPHTKPNKIHLAKRLL